MTGCHVSPPSIERSTLPGVSQSPTVALHASRAESAMRRRSAGTTSDSSSADGVEEDRGLPRAVERDGDAVSATVPWSAGSAEISCWDRRSKAMRYALTTRRRARTANCSTLLLRRTRLSIMEASVPSGCFHGHGTQDGAASAIVPQPSVAFHPSGYFSTWCDLVRPQCLRPPPVR